MSVVVCLSFFISWENPGCREGCGDGQGWVMELGTKADGQNEGKACVV